VSTGASVSSLKAGDRVVPLQSGLGTWRTAKVCKAANWHSVSSKLSLVDAATLVINPVTALSLLEEFVDLAEGDCVIQNGANSAVGQYVIAMARAQGVKTINIVRDRPNWQEAVDELEALGADLVASPEMVREAAKASGLPKPLLGLNCVCGEVATTMLKMLEQSGTLVTYGAMAKQPVTVPAPLLIFKDVRVRGFWCSGSSKAAHDVALKKSLLDRVAGLVEEGQIASNCTEVPFTEWQRAFEQGVRKPVLVMNQAR
jgi:mitochondrial enoyl-[acyl-carrier protein] reductase / trans-2-enoyl-CoA reductase